MDDRRGKHPTSVRLSPQAKELLARLADELGISQAAVLEIAIREYARGRLSELGSGNEKGND